MTATELRPMNLGELLDRTFTLYRSHFVLFVGIMALPQLFAIAANLFTQGIMGPQALMPIGGNAQSSPAAIGAMMGGYVAGMGVMALVYWIVYSVALGATTFAVSEVYLGRRTSVRESYRRMHGRFWRLMDVVFSVLLRLFLVFFLTYMGAGIIAVLVISTTTNLRQGGGTLGVLVAMLSVLAAMGVAFYFAGRLALGYAASIPALLLENLKAREAMKRSLALVKGNRARVFLVLLLTMLITYAAIFIFQGPFLVAMALTSRSGEIPVWISSLSVIAGGLAGAVCAPLMMIGLVLLYYDVRVRREAFDLQHMMAALGQPGASPPAPGVSAPAGPTP